MKFPITIFLFLSIAVTAWSQPWHRLLNVPGGDDVEAMLVDSSGRLIVSTDTGAFSTTDQGNTWQNDTAGLEAPDEFAFAEMKDGTLIAGTEIAGIFRSSDFGEHWESSSVGLPDSATVRGIVCNASQELFAALEEYGVFYSSDRGNHWVQRDTGLPKSILSCLTLASNGDLYVGLNGSIARSSNDGLNWMVCDTLSPQDEALALACDSSGTIFAGTFYTNVLRSSDHGMTWDTVSPPQTAPIRAIDVAGNSLFVGTYGTGEWKSSDFGNHWVPFSDSLSGKDLDVLCSSIYNDTELFIGTLTASVFKASLSPASSVSESTSTFKPSLSLERTERGEALCVVLNGAETIQLELYDPLGRQIRTLYSGFVSAGEHVFPLDMVRNGSGFVRLLIGIENQTPYEVIRVPY